MENDLDQQAMTHHFRQLLQRVGVSDARKEMKETPARYAKYLQEFLNPKPFTMTMFEEPGAKSMIVQNGIPVSSLCEHHTLPFFGTATVAYLPNGKIIGLSKLARLVEHYSRRFQNQERLTNDIGQALVESQLGCAGVGVSLRCVHTCMTTRGAKALGATTTTTFLWGAFSEDGSARQEFLASVEHPK